MSDIWELPSDVTFDRVKAEITGVSWQVIDTIEADCEDGEIVLDIPSDYAREELCKVVRDDIYYDEERRRYVFDFEGFWPAATDNSDARVAALDDIFAYEGDQRVGRIFLSDWSGTGSTADKSWVYFHYTDQDFSLSGYNQTRPARRPEVLPL